MDVTIPGYQILGKLGAGGMGLVFNARDIKNKRLVALKILYPKTVQNPTELARFAREAKLLIYFQHPNIVKGYQIGQFKGLYFLAMEYVKGPSVQNIIDKEKVVAEDLAINIILQAAHALDYLEHQGILHRDIKPDNLLLTPAKVVKLCDLGFAQPMVRKTGEAFSVETTSGTPQYMSPEQSRGQLDLDIRSDIYSLGATLYHMVTGKTPFSGTDNMEIMAKQVLEDLQSDEVKNRRLTPLTLYFIEKMMAKEKEIRYQNPAEVIADIKEQTEGFKSLEYKPE
jgi:serine/threonine-protein kinase